MSTMYELKPIIKHDSFVNLPTCMYEMKNLHENEKSKQECRIVSNVTKQVNNFLKTPLPEVIELEARQEKILESLAELKKQLSNLLKDVNKDDKEIKSKNIEKNIPLSIKKKIREHVNVDVTINVNPKKPCYSIIALKKIWDDVDFPVTCYLSSDMKESVDNIFKNTEETGKPGVINISLIWKTNDCQLIVSALQNYPIIGEINMLRYFSRLLGENNENIIETEKIDTILDISHSILFENNQKNINNYLSILSKKLDNKDNFFTGFYYPGIADVALWSTIKQVNPKLPENIKKWFNKCEKYFL
ncbi:hypothetical protein HCN44_007147 [Aphidius gifuensis]|uniref:Aminoacyl tRNA synthase complex-interacting multifunctional protein 2 n=1 Tax=Aphidius gifuensis TaxID=684658 RepID=A0A834XNM0_APHGI|nr:hypothetical protein HCN44_007147 [Aphidius gifuensis]